MYKQIDLKKTIDESTFRQIDIAKELDLSRQHINKYYQTNKMSKGQNIAFILCFEKHNINIHYI